MSFISHVKNKIAIQFKNENHKVLRLFKYMQGVFALIGTNFVITV